MNSLRLVGPVVLQWTHKNVFFWRSIFSVTTRCVTAVLLVCIFATGTFAQSVTERLRSCLAIEDGTKARLDCYDAIVPPSIEDCRLVKPEDQRITCFNRFLELLPVKPAPVISTVQSKPATVRQLSTETKRSRGSKDCSLPGLHRLPNGNCTSRHKGGNQSASMSKSGSRSLPNN
jgi:hypothetical protein